MKLQLLTLDNMIVAGRNISSISSVTLSSLWGKKYENYESMKSHTFSLEIFSRGKFFLFYFIYFKKSINQHENITML